MLRIAEVMECTIGGTRRHIAELSTGLARLGHQVTLLASAVRDPTFREDLARIAAAGVEVIEVPMRREVAPLADAGHFLRLLGHFARRRYDVIHTHSSKAGALGRMAARIAAPRARRVHTPHTFAFNFTAQFSERKRALFLAVERQLGRTTDRIVHVSASERDEGQALGIVPAARAVVIENGIDAAPYARARGDAVRAELGAAAGAPLVGSVGLLNEAKGHLDLVDAAAIVRRTRPDARFLVAGEGALRGAIEARIRERGLEGAFTLLGQRRDVPEVIAALDVFAMPSLWEGLPYVVLEAMAAGKPVVASDVNGNRDLVADGETGLLVPPQQPDALAAAILRLLADPPLAAALAARGREQVLARFSIDSMLARYGALFAELCPTPAKERA